VDTLSVVMMLVVSGVGTLIHIYSIGYMHSDVQHNGDPARYRRFFLFLNLFIASMMILVSADNFLMMFVGWEGVGLCSYLLIGFWFEKGKDGTGNAVAAKKAFIANRIGDFGLLVAMFLIYWTFGSLDFGTVFAAAPAVAAAHPTTMLLITLFMLLGVTGKSAQLPLYVWLPDAMAGPTPVSALIHAATMVTAGVYLVARSSAFYTLVPAAQTVVMWVGAATALFAATIAVAQHDIKKVLAYSTISQLGFMVAAVGMGATVAGMFHLVTHAFFKALLFLAAGSVIQGVERGFHHAKTGHEIDPQDMRNMGGLRKQMPLTFWVYLIGGLTLAGLAPLAGFFSKDEILAAASQRHTAIFVVLIIAAFFTAFYLGRQIRMVFFGEARSAAAAKATESSKVITVPLLILAALSVLGGLLNFPGWMGLEKWLAHTLGETSSVGFVWSVAGTSFALALFGLGIAWLIYGRTPLAKDQPDPLQKGLGPVFTGMSHKWWVDEFYGLVVLTPYKTISQFFAKPVDLGIIDGAGNGLAAGTNGLGTWLRRFQNGYVRSYALWMLIGLVAILTYLVLR
jgi:NADH-quinone oxidoreductase subunit L